MSGVKKLASQTLWYGVPTIASRFFGYLLSVALFRWYGPQVTADITQVYALIPFLNIIFTYGLETAYFRFAVSSNEPRLFNTLSVSLLVSTLLFALLLWQFTPPLARFTSLTDRPDYFRWMILILCFDTLSVIPFARLRMQEKPRQYAAIKVASVVLTILIAYYYLRLAPQWYAGDANHPLLFFYHPDTGIGYYIIANAVASAITLFLLAGAWKGLKIEFDAALWKEVMKYAMPLVIVGFGGMINEMLSRLVYAHVLDLPVAEEKRQLGIFGASYKVAVLITMFIQVFRMAAEPFFFKQSTGQNAQATYARVMKFFVMACLLMWLGIALFVKPIALLAYGKNYTEYADGIGIITILAMGSVFIGVYYNLSIWYKLTNRTWAGAAITLAGALITIALNWWWIPLYGYNGSAWATLICYGFMMLLSYWWGQRVYPVPYAWPKLAVYLLVAVCLYFLHRYLLGVVLPGFWMQQLSGVVLMLVYMAMLAKTERHEWKRMPLIGRFF